MGLSPYCKGVTTVAVTTEQSGFHLQLTLRPTMSGTQGESFISLFGYLNSIKRGCGSMGVTGTSPLPISHPDALLCLAD